MRAATSITAALAAAAVLASCAPAPLRPVVEEGAAPAGFPAASYRAAAARGARVFAIDPSRSLVTIRVLRGGSLARLGHDHVVAIRDLRGYLDEDGDRADLYARLDRMTVDEPELRREAHFGTQPNRDDIAGTRINMLTRVLHATEHPFVIVAVRGALPVAVERGKSQATTGVEPVREDLAQVTITLNGVARSIPVEMTRNARGADFEVTGHFAVDQTWFRVRPMSLLGGAITVEDRLDLDFDIRAHRLVSPVAAAANKAPG